MASKHLSPQPATAFAPGDQVVRYVNGKPLYCTVVIVMDETQLLIRVDQWPAGYTAPVRTSDVALVSHQPQPGLPM